MREPIDAAVSGLRDALDGLEMRGWSNEDCSWLIERMGRIEKQCAAVRTRAAVTLRRRGERHAARRSARAAGTWVGKAAADMDRREQIDATCPRTAAALDDGLISAEQAAEIAKTEAEAPGNESDLLAFAQSNSLRDLKDEGRRRRHATIGPGELHARQHAAQWFRHWRNDLGNVCFQGEVAPEVGIPFINRLEVETDRIFKAACRTGRAEPMERYRAEAFAVMLNGGGTPHATRADVVFTVDLNDYRRGGGGHIVGGGPIPREILVAMARDAFLKCVVHDGTNIHLVKHFGRHVPAEIRTALELGRPPDFDGWRCSDPDCDCRRGLQIDHLDPLANGGPTSWSNLDPKCRATHREKTEQDRSEGKLGDHGRRGPPHVT